jgi:hypothetical protein
MTAIENIVLIIALLAMGVGVAVALTIGFVYYLETNDD